MHYDHYWIEWNIEKVQSHIEEEATPDKFSWYCNDYVDQLATKAWLKTTYDKLQDTPTFLFPGAKAGCRIAGRIENNSLYMILKDEINGKR